MAFVIMGLFLWPEYQDLREAMIEAEIKDTDWQNMLNYSRSMDKMIEILNEEYEEEVKKMDDGIPDDHYIPSLFSEIRNASRASGIRVENIGSFSTRNHSEKDGITEIEISFAVRGDYLNFKNFLLRLENSARIKSIRGIRIDRIAGEDFDTLESNLTLITHSY